MINSQIRASYWMTFPLTIVNFNHFFIQPAPEVYGYCLIAMGIESFEWFELDIFGLAKQFFSRSDI